MRNPSTPFIAIIFLMVAFPLMGFLTLWIGLQVGGKEGAPASQSGWARSLSEGWSAFLNLPGLNEGLTHPPAANSVRPSPPPVSQPAVEANPVEQVVENSVETELKSSVPSAPAASPPSAPVTSPALASVGGAGTVTRDYQQQLEREREALPPEFFLRAVYGSGGLLLFQPEPAQEMMKFLKTRGFPHAFVSQSTLPGKGTPWFRVWLGYYNDFKSAREAGAFLEAKEMVERALVRRADNVASRGSDR